jgi:electron transfer flavoprotein beta subunit
MKFVVCAKLTPDTEQLADVKPEDVGTDDLGVTMVLNPWDEFAVEEALQLQERFDGEAVVLTVGNDDATEALKRAVAMGVEEAVLLSDDMFEGSDAWGTSHILAQAIKKIGDYTVILTGKQSVDGNGGLVGPGLAAQLGLPFVSNVNKIEDMTEESATVHRNLDEGIQTVKVKLPAVLAVSTEINEPRYPNFMGIRKASRMQYPAVGADELPGLDQSRLGEGAALLKWTNLRKPPARTGKVEFVQGGSPAETAALLVDKLIADKVL